MNDLIFINFLRLFLGKTSQAQNLIYMTFSYYSP